MGNQRVAGDVYIVSGSVNVSPPALNKVAVDTTTSGEVVLISANTTGASEYTITNSGSINIYITGSFNGTFFQPSVGVVRVGQNGGAGALTSTVEAVSASTVARFGGPYEIVRVVANSGSGVYRAALTYR